MPTKKNSKTVKNVKTKKLKKAESEKILNMQKSRRINNEDKMLEKVERYVDKNREKTSQEMQERKSKRAIQNFQKWDLELMISRITTESQSKEHTKKTSKGILYLIYIIIILLILIFVIKYFFVPNVPQIS